MSLKILEEKDNPLFNRKEIKASLDSEVTPSRTHVLELLSGKFKIPQENIKINKIKGNFGIKNFSIEASVYASKEEKDILEIKKKKEAVAKKEPQPSSPAPAPEATPKQ